jgi:site-specific DNA-methyltransferase (adenine-specific)
MIELIHGSAELLREYPYDVMICDPPFRDWVHKKATSQSKGGGTRHRDLGFDSLTGGLRETIATVANHAKRWALIYSDVETPHLWREAVGGPEWRGYVRTIPWIRWSMPNLTGTMPCQGFEVVSVFHGPGKKHWNGPGSMVEIDPEYSYPDCDALRELALRGSKKHKCEKPLDQALRLVSWFSDPGERVVDATFGYGTVAMACKILDRHFVGTDINPDNVQVAKARLDAPFPRDRDRIHRFVESVVNDDSAMTDKSRDRHQIRIADAQRAAAWL